MGIVIKHLSGNSLFNKVTKTENLNKSMPSLTQPYGMCKDGIMYRLDATSIPFTYSLHKFLNEIDKFIIKIGYFIEDSNQGLTLLTACTLDYGRLLLIIRLINDTKLHDKYVAIRNNYNMEESFMLSIASLYPEEFIYLGHSDYISNYKHLNRCFVNNRLTFFNEIKSEYDKTLHDKVIKNKNNIKALAKIFDISKKRSKQVGRRRVV